MSRTLLLQYTIVGLIVAACCVWVLLKIIKMARGKHNGCCGCDLHDKCARKHTDDTCGR